jgi:hypothetical protein
MSSTDPSDVGLENYWARHHLAVEQAVDEAINVVFNERSETPVAAVGRLLISDEVEKALEALRREHAVEKELLVASKAATQEQAHISSTLNPNASRACLSER